MKSVSIVVPAYNAGKTITRCLDSLVNQTLQDIEIIVVNDASTDDTWNVLLDYESRYPDKMIVVDGGVNRGSGGARNQGFDLASGEYIGLVDSDDYVALTMYEHLYNKAKEEDADIVDCAYYSELTKKAVVYTSDDLTGELDDNKRKKLIASGGYLVTKIFRNNLWNDPVIRMREKVRCLEDADILIYMLLRAKSISNVIELLYYYCDANDSATKGTELQSYYDSVYGAMESIYDLCHGMDSYEGAKEAVEYALINLYSNGVNRCLRDGIVSLGANARNINEYFNSIGYKEKQLLARLAELKQRVVSGSYRDNADVINRIGELDIRIMEECDRRFG